MLQIAAHEDDVPVEQLYEYCRVARKIMQGEHGVGRIIARPYVGEYPNYTRTPRRHDFSLDPTGDTMMDALARKGLARSASARSRISSRAAASAARSASTRITSTAWRRR